MEIALLLLAACQILAIIGVAAYLVRWANRKQADIEQRVDAALRDWIESPAEGEPSKLAELLSTMGAVVGSSAARSLRSSFQQEKSSAAMVANGLSDELQGAENPLIGLLTGGKRGKNAAVQRLGQMLMTWFSQQKDGGNGQLSLLNKLGKAE